MQSAKLSTKAASIVLKIMVMESWPRFVYVKKLKCLIIHGGKDISNFPLSDVCMFDVTNDAWTEVIVYG